MFRDWKIGKRLTIAFGLTLLLVGVVRRVLLAGARRVGRGRLSRLGVHCGLGLFGASRKAQGEDRQDRPGDVLRQALDLQPFD